MLIQKGGITRNVDKSRLHEYRAKGYAIPVVEAPVHAPKPAEDTSPKKQAKKPTAKE